MDVIGERAAQAARQMRERGIVFPVTGGRPPRGPRTLVERGGRFRAAFRIRVDPPSGRRRVRCE